MAVKIRNTASRPRQATRLTAICVVLVLASLAAACASRADVQWSPTATGSRTGPAATAEATAGPSSTPSQETSSSSMQASEPEPPVVIRWIRQFAPQGGGGSDRETIYFLLMRGECDPAHGLAVSARDNSMSGSVRDLYVAATGACLAAFEGRTDGWQDAMSRLDTLDGSEFSCWELELYDITTQLIDAHLADPQATFERSADGGESSCPVVTSLDPSHGSVTGGYVVSVIGENLPPSLPLYFGDSRVDAILQADGTASVTVPPAANPGIAIIHVADAPGRGVGTNVTFTYDHQPGATQDETIPDEPVTEPTPSLPTP